MACGKFVATQCIQISCKVTTLVLWSDAELFYQIVMCTVDEVAATHEACKYVLCLNPSIY